MVLGFLGRRPTAWGQVEHESLTWRTAYGAYAGRESSSSPSLRQISSSLGPIATATITVPCVYRAAEDRESAEEISGTGQRSLPGCTIIGAG